MYIKSQNRSTLVNADRVTAFAVLQSGHIKKWSVIAYTPNGKTVLGEYKSKERADVALERLSLAVTGTTCRVFRMSPDEMYEGGKDDGKESTDRGRCQDPGQG